MLKAILEQARAKLAPPGAWTQGAFARDSSGVVVVSDHETAVCWCALGAIFFQVSDLDHRLKSDAHELLEKAIRLDTDNPDALVSYWNDARGRTQKEVLAIYDIAIAMA